jgi:hypothetical protein
MCSLKARTILFALYRNQMSGNPVKIGDGYATVTGYKLPQPLVAIRPGRRERGSSPKSGYRFECARPGVVAAVCDRRDHVQLLRQEKDEASLFRVCGQDSLIAFILCFAGMKVFLFSSSSSSSSSSLFDSKRDFEDENEDEKRERLFPALVSQSPTRFAKIIPETIERSVYDQK